MLEGFVQGGSGTPPLFHVCAQAAYVRGLLCWRVLSKVGLGGFRFFMFARRQRTLEGFCVGGFCPRWVWDASDFSCLRAGSVLESAFVLEGFVQCRSGTLPNFHVCAQAAYFRWLLCWRVLSKVGLGRFQFFMFARRQRTLEGFCVGGFCPRWVWDASLFSCLRAGSVL